MVYTVFSSASLEESRDARLLADILYIILESVRTILYDSPLSFYSPSSAERSLLAAFAHDLGVISIF